MENTEARVNVTWAGNNGDLPDPMRFDATDADIRSMIQEAVRSGSVPGIPADSNASFQDFVIDRFTATADVPYNRLMIRPKTPFG